MASKQADIETRHVGFQCRVVGFDPFLLTCKANTEDSGFELFLNLRNTRHECRVSGL